MSFMKSSASMIAVIAVSSHGLRVSMVWFLMAVPLGFTLMIWRLLQSLKRDFQTLREGKPVYEGDKLFD